MVTKDNKLNIELDTGDLIAPKKDKRKHKRVNAIRKVPVNIIDAGGTIFHATLSDISNGGCRFSSEKVLPLDSFIDIRLSPNNIIKGRVAWGGKKSSINNEIETGVEFTNEIKEDIYVIAGVRISERKKPGNNIDVIVSTKDETKNSSYREISVLIDISEGGLQIKTKKPFVPGVIIKVMFPGGKTVRGQLRWCHRSEDTIEKRYFSGIAFIKNDMVVEDNNNDILSGGDDIEYYNNLGRFLRKDKRYIEALDSYEKAIKLQPKNEVLYFNRARIYMEMNQTDPAIKDLKHALSLNDKFPEAHILLKEMLKQWKDH